MKQENKRLEGRIQSLNSDLFKERATNADLSTQVKNLLGQLEEIKRRSIHPISEHESENEEDDFKETPEAVLLSIEKVEIIDSLDALKMPPPDLGLSPPKFSTPIPTSAIFSSSYVSF